jgi:hypothetical protein
MSAPASLHSIQSDRPPQVSQAVTCRHHQQASGHESHLERVEVVSNKLSHRSPSGRWPIGQWALGWWMLFACQPLPVLAWQSNPVTPGIAPAASQRQAFDLQHKTADQAASLLGPLLPTSLGRLPRCCRWSTGPLLRWTLRSLRRGKFPRCAPTWLHPLHFVNWPNGPSSI